MKKKNSSIDKLRADGDFKVIADFEKRTGTTRIINYSNVEVTLRIVVRKKKCKGYPVGQILTVNVLDFNWAEYDEDHFDEQTMTFDNEEFVMVLKEIIE